MKNLRIRKANWSLPLVFSFLLLSIVTRLFYNGEVLGLDYNLYYPDGVCYTAHAYEFSGLTPEGAWSKTLDEYQKYDAKYSTLSSELRPDSCVSVQARIIYPLLSAPFISNYGLAGMLVVPVIAVLLGILFIYFALRRLGLSEISIVVGLFALSASSSFLRWNIGNLPESLLFLWTSISLFLLVSFTPRDLSHRKAIFYISSLIGLIIISAVTKRSAHFWTILFSVIALILILNKDRMKRPLLLGIPIMLISITWIADRLAGALLGGQNSLWIATTATSCLKGIQVSVNPGNVTAPLGCENLTQNALKNMWNFALNEIGQLAVLDKPLFLLCGVLIIGVLLRWREVGPIAQICFLVSICTFGATMLNATLGLNFRLMTPALPYLIMGAVMVIDQLIAKARARI